MRFMGRSRREEYAYAVPGCVWRECREEVLRQARELAATKGKVAEGEPEEHVILVWPQVTAPRPSTHSRVA